MLGEDNNGNSSDSCIMNQPFKETQLSVTL